MEKALEMVKDFALEYGLKAVLCIVLLLIGLKVIKLIVKRIHTMMEKRKVDQTIIRFTTSLLSIGFKTLLVIALLGTFGVGVTSFVAIIGAISFAVGLALQGSLSNFAAGVILLILRPFKVGDYVEVSGLNGTVASIEIFSTILKTPDNKTIIIPNGNIIDTNIVNYSIEKTRRVDFIFGVGYESDIKIVKDILLKIANDHEMILDEPGVFVGLKDLSDSSIDFALRVWVDAENYWTVYYEIMESVKNAFDKANISIPYPHLQVLESSK